MIIAGEIKRFEDWYCKSPPKDRDTQWEDDYSAKEFARLWFSKNGKLLHENEIVVFIKKAFPGFIPLFLLPEHITRIDNFNGGHRNHDMFIYGVNSENEPIIVCIEAKVAEHLDLLVKQKIESSSSNEKSNIPERVKQLSTTLGLSTSTSLPLRYQLLTGMCGTIIEAANYNSIKAMFLVLQIVPDRNIGSVPQYPC